MFPPARITTKAGVAAPFAAADQRSTAVSCYRRADPLHAGLLKRLRLDVRHRNGTGDQGGRRAVPFRRKRRPNRDQARRW